MEVSWGCIWQSFLDSAHAELSRDTHPPSQLHNCFTLQYIQDRSLQTVYLIITVCVTYISKSYENDIIA
jgi:hypothetical protein